MDVVMTYWQIIQDPEYQRVVVPDGKVFSKTEESRLIVGYDKDFIVDYKRV